MPRFGRKREAKNEKPAPRPGDEIAPRSTPADGTNQREEQEQTMNEKTSDGAAAGTPRDDAPATDAQPMQRPLPEDQLAPLNAMIIEAQIVDALETVFDPEIPVNIYELGLIYGIDVKSDGIVDVTMTLTAPSCPAAQTLPREVEEKIRAINGVAAVNIDITFDPPWEMSRMTDAARLQLGLM